MIIREVIWLRQFANKIERKHHVSQDEVDETLAKQPPVKRMRRGAGEGEDLIAQLDKPMQDATCRSFSFTKGKDEHWLFLPVNQTRRS